MGTVIAFEAARRPSRHPPPPPGEGATILFFLGVRYEYDRGARAKRTRPVSTGQVVRPDRDRAARHD